jgi:hypothetical protein
MTAHRDNRLADAPMVPVDCGRCGAKVLARKSTWHQTSVQWTGEASAQCMERRGAEALASPGSGSLFLACSALRNSIANAVLRGELPVVDETVDVTR